MWRIKRKGEKQGLSFVVLFKKKIFPHSGYPHRVFCVKAECGKDDPARSQVLLA